MNDKKVSVVVPVYNVQKYIERCIRSLMEQDYNNIEIIPVDDGSQDESGNIIDRLSFEDSRIKPIHKINGGVSSARNAGVNLADGDYIMFVDGDDWVDSDYVSYFLQLVLNHNAEVGMDTRNFAESSDKKYEAEEAFTISAEKAIEWIYDDHIFVAVWNKIYSSELLNKVKFSNEIWYGEGMLFNIECLQYVDRVAIGNKPVYHQTFNPDSAMRKFSLSSNYCGIASLWLQKAKWRKSNPQIEEQWDYHRYRFNMSIISGLVRAGQVEEHKDEYKACVRNLRKYFYLPMKYEKNPKMRLVWIGYYINPMMMAKHAAKNFKKKLRNLGGYNLSLYYASMYTFAYFRRCA